MGLGKWPIRGEMRSKNILLFAEPSRVYDRHFLRGVVRYASCQEHWNFYGDILDDGKTIAVPANVKFDGILTREFSRSHLASLYRMNLPIIVYQASEKPVKDNEIRVLTAHREIGRMAAQYFTRLGFQNFAYLGSPTAHWNSERSDGFREVVQNKNVFFFTHPETCGKYNWDDGAALAKKWLKELPKPVAVLAGNDHWGRFAVNLCLEENIQVPQQVSILGVDDDSLICDFCYKSLSSIRLDVTHAGYKAAEQLDRLIHRKPAREPAIPVSPLMVVERQSTGCFSAGDPHVARAVEFMGLNFTNRVNVNEVSRFAGLSRRSLEQRFKETTGETLAGALRRIRAEHACKLLLETDQAVYAIAQNLGYDDEKHFSRYFKKETGLTPSAYRRKKE
jgi:LacI family transcriptional regulator